LLTIVGPGGGNTPSAFVHVGKSIEVHDNRVWLVGLAPREDHPVVNVMTLHPAFSSAGRCESRSRTKCRSSTETKRQH
jgi:hypothetical protein